MFWCVRRSEVFFISLLVFECNKLDYRVGNCLSWRKERFARPTVPSFITICWEPRILMYCKSGTFFMSPVLTAITQDSFLPIINMFITVVTGVNCAKLTNKFKISLNICMKPLFIKFITFNVKICCT